MRPAFIIVICFLSIFGCRQPDDHFILLFDRVDGLTEEAPLLYRGLQIGHVSQMDVSGNKILVKLRLERKIDIPVDSKFIIQPSLLSNTAVTLETGSSKRYLHSGDTLTGIYSAVPERSEVVKDSLIRQHTIEGIASFVKGLSDQDSGRSK